MLLRYKLAKQFVVFHIITLCFNLTSQLSFVVFLLLLTQPLDVSNKVSYIFKTSFQEVLHAKKTTRSIKKNSKAKIESYR